MDLSSIIGPMTPLDGGALAFLLVSWLVSGWLIERERLPRPSVAVLMAGYRREWLRHSITRDPRVFDAIIMANLREGTAFFASACLIAIGGALALISNLDRLTGIATDLSLDPTPKIVWEIKILLVLLLVTNAFLKFVWSNRIFGYCSVMIGAISNEPDDPVALRRAEQAGELNVIAARSFNRGLRSVYFSLGALAWLLGAVPLILATVMTLFVVCRREFWSNSRDILIRRDP